MSSIAQLSTNQISNCMRDIPKAKSMLIYFLFCSWLMGRGQETVDVTQKHTNADHCLIESAIAYWNWIHHDLQFNLFYQILFSSCIILIFLSIYKLHKISIFKKYFTWKSMGKSMCSTNLKPLSISGHENHTQSFWYAIWSLKSHYTVYRDVNLSEQYTCILW